MSDEPPTAPDLITKVIGYRQWKLSEAGTIHPLSVDRAVPWRVGVNEAVCRPFHTASLDKHVAPDALCGCGLYAYHSLSRARNRGAVVGVVTAWGKIEVHGTGFRAQYAEPVVFGFDPTLGHSLYLRTKRFVRQHGRQLVLLQELEEVAANYGKPIPDELRPDTFPEDILPGEPLVVRALKNQVAWQRQFNALFDQAMARYRR